jgi:DNA-binding NtrC family response regulator
MLIESALTQLQDHPWPNNLRELDHVLAQAAALADGNFIEPRHLALAEPTPLSTTAPTAQKSERLQDVIQQHVLEVLTRCGGNKLRAAELLGISRSTLYRMLESSSPHPLPE